MKIKIIKDEGEYKSGTIIDCDVKTATEFIKKGIADIYTEEIEKKDAEKVEDKITEEVKEIKKEKDMTKELEVKDGATIQVVRDADPQWKSMGEFLGAVVKASRHGQVDKRLTQKSTGQNEATPADGGYTVTTDIARFIAQQAQGASVVEQKCSHLEIGANYTGIKIPQLKETVRSATSLYGAVRIYAPAEGVGKTAFVQQYDQVDVQLKKLCAVNYLTDELLQDNTALESFIRMNVGKAFGWVKDNEIINGTLSTATPIVNDLSCAEVTVAGANPTAAEIASIYAANLNRTRAEWFMSTDQYAHLISLATTGTFPLYQPNYAIAPLGTLLGRPINVIEQSGVATDENSFMFLDLTDYLVIGKGGIEEATSIHVKFLEDETAFRWTTRFGGAPLMYSKITLLDGSVVSSFVTRD